MTTLFILNSLLNNIAKPSRLVFLENLNQPLPTAESSDTEADTKADDKRIVDAKALIKKGTDTKTIEIGEQKYDVPERLQGAYFKLFIEEIAKELADAMKTAPEGKLTPDFLKEYVANLKTKADDFIKKARDRMKKDNALAAENVKRLEEERKIKLEETGKDTDLIHLGTKGKFEVPKEISKEIYKQFKAVIALNINDKDFDLDQFVVNRKGTFEGLRMVNIGGLEAGKAIKLEEGKEKDTVKINKVEFKMEKDASGKVQEKFVDLIARNYTENFDLDKFVVEHKAEFEKIVTDKETEAKTNPEKVEREAKVLAGKKFDEIGAPEISAAAGKMPDTVTLAVNDKLTAKTVYIPTLTEIKKSMLTALNLDPNTPSATPTVVDHWVAVTLQEKKYTDDDCKKGLTFTLTPDQKTEFLTAFVEENKTKFEPFKAQEAVTEKTVLDRLKAKKADVEKILKNHKLYKLGDWKKLTIPLAEIALNKGIGDVTAFSDGIDAVRTIQRGLKIPRTDGKAGPITLNALAKYLELKERVKRAAPPKPKVTKVPDTSETQKPIDEKEINKLGSAEQLLWNIVAYVDAELPGLELGDYGESYIEEGVLKYQIELKYFGDRIGYLATDEKGAALDIKNENKETVKSVGGDEEAYSTAVRTYVETFLSMTPVPEKSPDTEEAQAKQKFETFIQELADKRFTLESNRLDVYETSIWTRIVLADSDDQIFLGINKLMLDVDTPEFMLRILDKEGKTKQKEVNGTATALGENLKEFYSLPDIESKSANPPIDLESKPANPPPDLESKPANPPPEKKEPSPKESLDNIPNLINNIK